MPKKKEQDIPTLEIDLDKECARCGEKGVTKSGKCVKCVSYALTAGKVIGFFTMVKAKTELCNMLDEYHKEIDEAYVKADGDLTVALA